MNTALIEKIRKLAGPLRSATFAAAAEFVLQATRPVTIVETGCYRGAACDGQSTLILALLAKETGGKFLSHELHFHNVTKASELLHQGALQEFATFVTGDSAATLAFAPPNITLAYLDSWDFEADKWVEAQSHQLAEVGRLLPKMAPQSGFLLDDCDLPKNGKVGLSVPAILRCGFQPRQAAYQRFFVRQ